MDPVTALRQIAYYKDRNRHDPRRVMAYRNAADIIEGLDDAARQRHGQANSWQSLAGIGPKPRKSSPRPGLAASRTCWLNYALTLRISVEGRSVPHCAGICICIRTGRTGPRRSRR